MAIEAGDFKTGLTVIVDGDPWVVLDFQHVKPGKGAAILKTKMKNLKTGSTQERNFNASTKFEAAMIEKKMVTYSYEADNTYFFPSLLSLSNTPIIGAILGIIDNFDNNESSLSAPIVYSYSKNFTLTLLNRPLS